MRCSTVLEAVKDYILIKDMKLRYTDINSTLVEILDQPRERVIGKTFEEIERVEISAEVIDAERRVLNGHVVKNEYCFSISGLKISVNAGRRRKGGSCQHPDLDGNQ